MYGCPEAAAKQASSDAIQHELTQRVNNSSQSHAVPSGARYEPRSCSEEAPVASNVVNPASDSSDPRNFNAPSFGPVRHYGGGATAQAKVVANDMIAAINAFYTAPRDVQDAFLNVFRQECSSMTTSRIGALLAAAVGTTF